MCFHGSFYCDAFDSARFCRTWDVPHTFVGGNDNKTNPPPLGNGSMTTALKSASCNSLFSFYAAVCSLCSRVLVHSPACGRQSWKKKRWVLLQETVLPAGGGISTGRKGSPACSSFASVVLGTTSAAAILAFAALGSARHPWATLSLIEKGNLFGSLSS